MGCVSSKDSKKTHLHTDDHVELDNVQESRHLVSLTSSSYGLLNIERPPSCQGSFLSFHRKSKKYQAITTFDDSSVLASGPDAEPGLTCPRMLVKSKDNNEQNSPLLQNDIMETINTWELMEGLEDTPAAVPCTRGSRNNKLRLPMSSKPPISLEWPHVSNSSLLDSGSPLWKKYYAESETVKEGLVLCAHVSPGRRPSSPITESPSRVLACMPFVKSLRRLPSCSSLREQDDSRSTASSTDILPDRSPSPGLKLLLSPANSPSYYLRPPTKRAGIHAASFSFDGNTENLRKTSHLKFKRSFDCRKRSSRQQSMDSPKALQDVPLFDPLVIATFEQAIMASTAECSCEDMRQHSEDMLQPSMDEITTNSSFSDHTWPSSEMASDAESIPQCRQKQETQTCAQLIPSAVRKREEFTGLLTKYEARCPTQGDSKVVLYHTSLRGVRKTYEDCATVRVILKGLGVQVDERDVWMHAKYKEELLGTLGDVLKGVQLVPRLFIKGRYIGGAEEVKRLHENGSLARLMDGIAMDVFQRVCDGCGDVRFVPCLKCSGSCKVRNRNNEVSRCLVCNENGLILCPICAAST